ncbi:hypothetical protein JQ584_49830 [Bradyrhizobium liaoningense]|nr:hypothetical protein [Bradyrhizobium liaoningense]
MGNDLEVREVEHDKRLAQIHLHVGEVVDKEMVESVIPTGEVEAPIWGTPRFVRFVAIDKSGFLKKREVAVEVVATIDPSQFWVSDPEVVRNAGGVLVASLHKKLEHLAR